MNCPECRKKLWYWAALSYPNDGHLVYLCQNCSIIIAIDKAESPLAFASWRGVRILRAEMTKRGYTLPPSNKRGTLKASTSPGKVKVAHPSRGGVS